MSDDGAKPGDALETVVYSPNHTREVISLGIGQFGVQYSQQMWRLYCLEHDISVNGLSALEEAPEDIAFTTFFNENSQGRFIPRCCLFDLEPSVCDQIQNTDMKFLFDPEKIVYAPEDGANVYARGKFIASKYIHPTMMLALRKTMESCDALSFIHMYNACGGGTGTGYTNKLADDCVDVFKMGNLMAFNIITSPTYKTAPTEYLNNLLYWGEGLIEASIKYCINFDNESMYSYIASQHSPTYWHVNQLLSYVASGLTSRMRFAGELSCDFTDIETNMIPFKSLNFLVASYAPVNFGKTKTDEGSITKNVMNQLLFTGIDQFACQYICATMLYRGPCSPLKVCQALNEVKGSVEFVPWMPTGFKIGISSEPVVYTPDSIWQTPKRAVTLLANHGGIKDAIKRIRENYEPTFDQKAFFHHFIGAGMEEGAFTEAMEKADLVVSDYNAALSSGGGVE
jgi:tubulin alpha